MCEFIIKNNIFIFIIMNSPSSISDSILQTKSTTPFVSSSASNDSFLGFFSTGSSASSNNSSGFFSGLANVGLTTWLIFFLILAFLGFNIFVYLAKGTQDITSFFAPLLQKIIGATSNLVGQVVDISAEGAKTVVGGTASAINSGLTSVQNVNPNNASSSVKSQPVQNTIQQPDIMANNTLNNSLNSQKQKQVQNDDYLANEASSSIGGSGKAGWCYIGEDRGFRSCVQVDETDVCMSGDIFPSQEICVNPNLRS
jgi:hypothetical protein